MGEGSLWLTEVRDIDQSNVYVKKEHEISKHTWIFGCVILLHSNGAKSFNSFENIIGRAGTEHPSG